MKNRFLIITFTCLQLLLITTFASHSFSKDSSFIIEKNFESREFSIDKTFILNGSKNKNRKYLIFLDGFLLFVNTKEKKLNNNKCQVINGTWDFKYRKYLNYRVIGVIQNENNLFLLTPTTLTMIDIDKCYNSKKNYYYGKLLKKTKRVSFWGAAGFNGFFCDMTKSKTQLLLLKCDGEVTAYNLKTLKVISRGQTIEPQTTMRWSDGTTHKAYEPELYFSSVNDKIYIFGNYSIGETINNDELIINEIDEFSLNIKNRIIPKCKTFYVKPVHLFEENEKLTVYVTNNFEMSYTALNISNNECVALDKRIFWKNTQTEFRERQRGLFSGRYFFDGSIKNAITEEVFEIDILKEALKRKNKTCKPRGFYVSPEDGSVIAACANEIIILEDFFEVTFIDKINDFFKKTF